MAEPFNVTFWHYGSLCTCSLLCFFVILQVCGGKYQAGSGGLGQRVPQDMLSPEFLWPSPGIQSPLGLAAKSQLLSGVSGSFCAVDGCL